MALTKKDLTEALEPVVTKLNVIEENTRVSEHLYSLIENRSYEVARAAGQNPDEIDDAYAGWTKPQLERLAAFIERKLKKFA